MMKTGWWSVDFTLTLDGEEVSFDELSDNSRQHIIDCLKEGYEQGELIEEDEEGEQE